MKFLFTLLSLFTLLAVRAEQPDTVRVQPTLEQLSAEVETLKAKTLTWERMREMLRVSGYLQMGYEWADDGTSTFFIKRARMSLSGNLLKTLDYKIQADFYGTAKLLDAYFRYIPYRQLGAQFGEFKIPFAIENTEYPPFGSELIDYPVALIRLMGYNDISGINATGRGLGGQLFGGFFQRGKRTILNYNLAVLNGEGINTKDRNKSKDVVARVMIRPLDGLIVAASGYWGEYSARYLKRNRYSFGVCYDWNRMVLRSEYTFGTTGLVGKDGRITDLDSGGWYALAGWRITPSWMPVVRYDTYRENVDMSSTRQTNYTVGVLWQPYKFFRCQLNYTFENYASRTDCNRVALMLTGLF